MAYTHDRLYATGHDHTPARLTLAEAAIQRAFELRPNAGEAHLARARNLYFGYLDFDAALAELAVAQRDLPNDARVPELTGYIVRRQGKQEEALQHLNRALKIDPQNLFILQQIAISYNRLRRYDEMAAALNRSLAITPDDALTLAARASNEMDWKADPRPLHAAIDFIMTRKPDALGSLANIWVLCAWAERDPAAVSRALEALGQNEFRFVDAMFMNHECVEGIAARAVHDEAKARQAFTAARAKQEKIVQAQPNYGPALSILGLIDAGLGNRAEALREGRRAVELLPVTKDSINGAHMIQFLAIIAAWVGEKDLACEQLAIVTRMPGPLSYGQLKLFPFWDPLRGDPRFEKIVASLAPKL